MASYIDGTEITLTRGDTFKTVIRIENQDGEAYQPQDGDVVRFALNKKYKKDDEGPPLILKVLDNEDLLLELKPEDTKNLKYGPYVYDIEITLSNGEVYTVIDRATLILSEEVY